MRDDTDKHIEAANAATDKLLSVETYIDAASKHAEDSDIPDHEVGDLQDYLRAAWELMTPEQKIAFWNRDDVQETFTMGE